VISELDIWRAANLRIRQRGGNANAELEAARLQALMLELVSARIGRRISRSCCAAAYHCCGFIRDIWDRLLDFAIATWLGVLDRLAPLPETAVDRAIREEGERLRKAFPAIDFDSRGPRRSRFGDTWFR
jgi:hypothetical protein